MTQPKASTLQQRFGFRDDDMKNPNHDQIMIWLDTHAETIIKLIVNSDSVWDLKKDNLEHFVKQLGDPPSKPNINIQRKTWEYAVTGRNQFMVGFIDMVIEFNEPYLYVHRDKWEVTHSGNSILFEVKTSIPSLGELIRQIRMYQEHVRSGKFYVIASDDTYVKQLNQQGIGFIKYPDFQVFHAA